MFYLGEVNVLSGNGRCPGEIIVQEIVQGINNLTLAWHFVAFHCIVLYYSYINDSFT